MDLIVITKDWTGRNLKLFIPFGCIISDISFIRVYNITI